MEIIQISIVAICATILTITLKGQRPEFSVLISVTTGVIIVIYISPYLKSIIDIIKEISDDINLDLSFIEIVLKIVAIAYICEFSSHICKDAGECAIASKVELAGKILILFTSAPIMLSILELLSQII